MKRRLAVGRIRFHVPEIRRLPAVLSRIESGIEGEAMNVEVWIGNAANRSRRKMHELCPSEVAGDAIFLRSFLADPSCNLAFQLAHRFRHGVTKRF